MNKKDILKTVALMLRGIIEDSGEIEEFLRRFPQIKLEFQKPSIFKKAFYHYLKRRKINYYKIVLNEIINIRKLFKKWKGVKKRGEVKYLVRVDDFPRWDNSFNNFLNFHEIFKKYKIPYLLGVTPLLSLNVLDPKNKKFRSLTTNEADLLKEPIITVGLHGLTHQTILNKRWKRSEFIGLSSQEIENRVVNGIKELAKYNIESHIFIPPFNAIDEKNYEILKRYFKIITGGPESIKTLGFKITPCYFKGALYIPSYPPVYGSCKEIVNFIKSLEIEEDIIVPITLHWSYEAKNNFEDVRELSKLIRNKTILWQNLYETEKR